MRSRPANGRSARTAFGMVMLAALVLELLLLAAAANGTVRMRPLLLLLLAMVVATVLVALRVLIGQPLWRPYARWANYGLGFVLGAFLLLLAANTAALLKAPFNVLDPLNQWNWEVGLLAPTPTTLLNLTPDGVEVFGRALPYGAGWSLQAYFLLLWLVILASLIVVLRRARPLLDVPLDRLVERTHELVEMGNLYVLSIAVGMLVTAVAWAFDHSPRVPDFTGIPPWLTMFLLANASVWEEVQGRILLLGLPLLLVHWLARRERLPLRRYLLGGDLRLDPPAAVLMMTSALIFAYLHVVYGWDWWKFPGTLLAGLMFGYLFLRYGVASSILFHFAFDYAAVWFYLQHDEGGLLALLFSSVAMLAIMVLIIAGLLVLPLVLCHYVRRHLQWWEQLLAD